MRNQGLNLQLLAGLAALCLPMLARGAEGAQLRLVAETSGVIFDQFSVKDDQMVVRRGDNVDLVPAQAVWRLDGDLRASAEFFWFGPEYDVVTTVANELPEADPVLRHALIRLRGRTAWNTRTLRDGIIVVVWLVDGRVVEVIPVVARARHDETAGLVAAAVVPLTADTARGTPAVLLWQGNRFVAPRRWSKDATADAALAELFLGTTAQVAARVREMKNINLRPDLPPDDRSLKLGIIPGEIGALIVRRDVESGTTSFVDGMLFSLPDIAIEAGRTDALRVMIEHGAEMNRTGSRPSGALQAAAQKGRFETMAFLQSGSVEALATESSLAELRRQALAAGHADVAALLVQPTAADAGGIARLALLEGDLAALTQLIARGATSTLLAQPSALVAFNIRLGRVTVVRTLLQAGLSPQGATGETPWLVTAAAAAQPDIVRALLEKGAAVDGSAPGGATPLIAAATRGSVECVDLLLEAGANANATGAHDLTALHYAAMSNQPAVVQRMLERAGVEQRRDADGRSPLDLALATQSTQLVELLTRHGATIDVTRPGFEEAIEHALAIDAVELLQRAAADGWNPHARFREHWAAAAIADLHGAKQCATWLATLGPVRADSVAKLERGEVAAALIAGDKPADVRIADVTRPEVSAKVTGVVATDGAFLFPRVTNCDDARLAHAIVAAARSWRFRPATIAGHAVASPVTLMIPFAGADRRVHAASEVETMPTLKEPALQSTERAAVGAIAHLFQPGRGGGTAMSATVDFGAMVPTELGDFWAAASIVVEADGQPGEVQMLGSEGMVPPDGWGRALSAWKFTPGQSNGRPVRTRVTLLVRSGK